MPKNAVKTRFEGVYSIESTKKRYEGKPDVCFYYVIKVDGKKQWHKAGWRSEGYTATAAHDLRSKHVQSLRHGNVLPTKKGQGCGLTFDQAWEAYEKRYLYTLKSAPHFRLIMNRYLLPVFGGRRLENITPLDVEKLKKQLDDHGLSPQSIVHALGYLNRIYEQTFAWGMHQLPSPTVGVSRPRVQNARTRYLTKEEASRLLEDLMHRSPLWHDIAALSLATGCRLSEIRTLIRGKVDLMAGVMEVTGKTGRRMVQLSEKAQSILRPRMSIPHSALVFPSPRGGLVDISANSFKRAVEACKLNSPDTPREEKVVFHTLRHTFASWLAIEGVPLLVIAELLGHSSLEMTKRYSHLCPDNKKQAVDIVSRALQGVMSAF